MVKSHTSKELKRRLAFKTPRKAELIVCEGTTTEPEYFNALKRKLRLHALIVDVMSPKEEDSTPINIVNYAVNKKREGAKRGMPYSKVWCVIDVEIPTHKTLTEAWEKASHIKNLEVILTNPFFEYWFLLHFEKVATPFQKDKELHSKLNVVHPTYKKDRIGFDILYPHTETAIKNAKEVIVENKCGEYLRDFNPSTHVHKLVEYLKKIVS